MFNYFEWIQKVGIAFWFLNTLLFVAIRNTVIPPPNPKYLPLQTNMVQMVQKTDYLRKQFKICKISQNLYNLQQIDEKGNILWNQYLQPSFLHTMLQNLNVELNLHALFDNSNFKVREIELVLKIPNTWQRGGGISSSQPIPSRVESIIQTNDTGSIQSIMRAAGSQTRLPPQSILRVAHRYQISGSRVLENTYFSEIKYQKYIDQIWEEPRKANSSYGELQSFQILRQAGFEVISCDPQSPEELGIERSGRLNIRRRPDFGIENVVFDCYTPHYNRTLIEENKFTIIGRRIHSKVNKKKQASRIVLNAYNWPVYEIAKLAEELDSYVTTSNPKKIKNLEEILLVKRLPDGTDYICSFTPTGEYLKPSNLT